MQPQYFSAPTRLVFGAGSIAEIGVEAGRLRMTRPAVVTDTVFASLGYVNTVCAAIGGEGVTPIVLDDVSHEPTVELVDRMAAVARGEGCDGVIGLGGGSCLDAAKAVAMLLANDGCMDEYLTGQPIEHSAVPLVALPTTFGTGSEATSITVILNAQTGVKKGLKNDHFYPRVAIVDPELGQSMPPVVAASTGMDAFAHALESYTSRVATPFSDVLALRAMGLISRAVRGVTAAVKPASVLEEMALGSTLAGMAFSNSSTGLAHSLAERISTRVDISHGELVTIMLPAVIEFNQPEARSRYEEAARVMGLLSAEVVPLSGSILADGIRALCSDLGLKTHLGAFGIRAEDLVVFAQEPLTGTSFLHNPRLADREDVLTMYRAAL